MQAEELMILTSLKRAKGGAPMIMAQEFVAVHMNNVIHVHRTG
jgi:hypothetical protein